MYSLVARQAMTDMAFVGPMTMALALGALALLDDDGRGAAAARARLAGAGRTTRCSTGPSALFCAGDRPAADHRFGRS